jgi:uncharacterized protein YuzE
MKAAKASQGGLRFDQARRAQSLDCATSDFDGGPGGAMRCAYCALQTASLRLFRQDQTMRVRVDREADAVYVNLTDRAIKDSAEVADGIVVDYDDDGRIVGVEILDASKRTGDPTALTQFNPDLPKAS